MGGVYGWGGHKWCAVLMLLMTTLGLSALQLCFEFPPTHLDFLKILNSIMQMLT